MFLEVVPESFQLESYWYRDEERVWTPKPNCTEWSTTWSRDIPVMSDELCGFRPHISRIILCRLKSTPELELSQHSRGAKRKKTKAEKISVASS